MCKMLTGLEINSSLTDCSNLFARFQIEQRRQDLARHPDFEPLSLYQLLDVNNSQEISSVELMKFMNKHFLSPN